jgi:transcriptional regulator with XRE-family HTH domain
MGLKLKLCRYTQHITLSELSRRTGLSFSQLKKWENGLSMPSASGLKKLAAYYGISVSIFLTGLTEEMMLARSDIPLHIKLKYTRYKEGLTTKECARQMHMSSTVVAMGERGRRYPSKAHIAWAAACLGVPRETLILSAGVMPRVDSKTYLYADEAL